MSRPKLTRDQAAMAALVSTHTVMGIRGGEFISLMAPPEACQTLAAQCRNIGAWPVLVGQGTEKDTMLSSPITLYDYPQDRTGKAPAVSSTPSPRSTKS